MKEEQRETGPAAHIEHTLSAGQRRPEECHFGLSIG
jgi:hypothetical protein